MASRLSIFVVNLSLYSNFINVFACTIRWLFCSILSRSCNCLKLSKTLQHLVCHIEMSFICSIGVFPGGETLELLTIPLSFEDLLPRLTFSCFCFICGSVPLVFICDYRKCRRLSEPYFLSCGWMSPPNSMCELPHVLQFSSGTVPLDFVWLSHNALSLTINLLIVFFYFIHYPYIVWTATPFSTFSEWNCSTFLCVNAASWANFLNPKEKNPPISMDTHFSQFFLTTFSYEKSTIGINAYTLTLNKNPILMYT